MKVRTDHLEDHLQGELAPNEIHSAKPKLRKFREREPAREARDKMRIRERSLFDDQNGKGRKI